MKTKIEQIALRLADKLQAKGGSLVTAESCTGGLISAYLTDIAGSSNWFDRAYITYSNTAKQEMVGVKASTLAHFGAVSAETVCEMAKGALPSENGFISVAVSGIAGPGGGSDEKPVGTVWIGWCSSGGEPEAEHFFFQGDRSAIRQQVVYAALNGVLSRI